MLGCSASGIKVRSIASNSVGWLVVTRSCIVLGRGSAQGDRTWGRTLARRRARSKTQGQMVSQNLLYADETSDRSRRPTEKTNAISKDERDELTRQAATALSSKLRAATRQTPCIVVADQAVSRGLHLDDVDVANQSSFIIGKLNTGRRSSSLSASQAMPIPISTWPAVDKAG